MPLRTILICALLYGVSISCSSVKGPIYPKRTPLETTPGAGVYHFVPPVPFFQKQLVGEAIVEPSGRKTWSPMTLRWAGRLRNGSLRIRSYQGRAILAREDDGSVILEFRPERCFIYGKKEWEERLRPLEMWDCDHLIYQFRESRDSMGNFVYKPVHSSRTSHSDWSGEIFLVPAPPPNIRNTIPSTVHWSPGEKNRRFVGQVMGRNDRGDLVLFGHDAPHLLRKGAMVAIVNASGREIARVRVRSIPGDFVLTGWSKNTPQTDDGELTGLTAYGLDNVVSKGWLD